MLSEAADDAWSLWLDINSGRTLNGMGVSPISWADLHAWSQIRGRKLSFTELELIRTVDAAFVANSQKKKEQG